MPVHSLRDQALLTTAEGMVHIALRAYRSTCNIIHPRLEFTTSIERIVQLVLSKSQGPNLPKTDTDPMLNETLLYCAQHMAFVTLRAYYRTSEAVRPVNDFDAGVSGLLQRIIDEDEDDASTTPHSSQQSTTSSNSAQLRRCVACGTDNNVEWSFGQEEHSWRCRSCAMHDTPAPVPSKEAAPVHSPSPIDAASNITTQPPLAEPGSSHAVVGFSADMLRDPKAIVQAIFEELEDAA
ncbi:hypothetical protein OC834_005819 [Tilletia horrida]|uniref:Uncharacterized protein n=1 Tax=Tilletia horrida TaxID=155126 RepID=A0AAN6JIB0_9BASI|nr:hypothetical protein OC834_005819 [Tilletia horrida]KAK0524565.1 hypothetical protein OC842_005794 [Tilletia horrida]